MFLETSPLLAVTRIELVDVCFPGDEPPEHPVRTPSNAVVAIVIAKTTMRDVRLRRSHNSWSGNSTDRIPAAGESSFEVCFTVVIVSDVVAELPSESVTCAGAKLQVAPEGNPEQLNTTVPAMPHLEATCKLSGEEADPLVTVRLAAAGESTSAGSFA